MNVNLHLKHLIFQFSVYASTSIVSAGVYEPVIGVSTITLFIKKNTTAPIIICPTPTSTTIAQAGIAKSPKKRKYL